MENLLYLSEIQKKFQIGLVSILPEIFVKKLNMIPIGGVKKSMDYIFSSQNSINWPNTNLSWFVRNLAFFAGFDARLHKIKSL